MTARIIDGKAVARKLRTENGARVEQLLAQHGVRPGLAVILVGGNAASRGYVRNKVRACAEAGIRSELIELPVDAPESLLLGEIDRLNADSGTHGILVQLPLPGHIAMRRVLERFSVAKDVDGFHLYNVGGLLTGTTVLPRCTPFGVQKLLEHEKAQIVGAQRRRRRREQQRRQADRDDADAAGCDRLHLP